MKPSYRLVISAIALLVLIYGLFTGTLIQSFEQTPYSTGFIIFVMIIYVAMSVLGYLKSRKK